MLADDLFANPDLFPVVFDGDDLVFAPMDRDAYARSIFLDPGRISASSAERRRVPWRDVAARLAARSERPAPPHFILHIAHCGSTLLARALDVPGRTLVLREPAILRQLGAEAGGIPAGATLSPEWQQRLQLALALLGRRYAPDEPVIVKANVPVNFMLPELVAAAPGARYLALHFPLEEYVVAIVNPERIHWLQSISAELDAGLTRLTGTPAPRTAAEAIGRLWLAEIRAFEQLLEASPGSASLNADEFYADPATTLARAFELFGSPAEPAEVAAIAGSELFTRYSKNPERQYSNATRLEIRRARHRAVQGEIKAARACVERAARSNSFRLARPLVGARRNLFARS